MKLNHINLVVADVTKAASFFERNFDFKCERILGEDAVAVLQGTDHFTLVLFKNKNGLPVYPDTFHIGFMQDSAEQVMEVFQRLKSNGVEIDGEPKKIRDSFGFYFQFEKLLIEVGHYY